MIFSFFGKVSHRHAHPARQPRPPEIWPGEAIFSVAYSHNVTSPAGKHGRDTAGRGGRLTAKKAARLNHLNDARLAGLKRVA